MRKGSYYGLIIILLFVVALITSGCGGSNRKDNEPTEYVKVVYDGTTYMFTSGWDCDGGAPSGRREGHYKVLIVGTKVPQDDEFDLREAINNGCKIRISDIGTGTYVGENVTGEFYLDGTVASITDLAVTLQKYEIVGGEIIGEFNGKIGIKPVTGSFKVKHFKDWTIR